MNLKISTPYLTFLRRLLVFSAILGMIATGFYFLVPSKYITPALPFLFVFFIAVTLAGYYFILRSAGKAFITFINYYLVVTVLKLFLFIGVIFLYLFLNKADAAPFAISFLILYLFYMVFEVVNLVLLFKSPPKSEG
jgi:hypothetical protein